jgi:hypothetical protein
VDFNRERVEQNEIPNFLRTAMLLKRDPHNADKSFQTTIQIKERLYLSGMLHDTVDRLLGYTEREPIEFDPREEDTEGIPKDTRDNLRWIDLEALSGVITAERVEWGDEDEEGFHRIFVLVTYHIRFYIPCSPFVI